VQDDTSDEIAHLYDHPARVAQYDRLRLSDDENWQRFLQRARTRSLGTLREDEDQAVAPRAGDKLWEISCKVGDYLPALEMIFTRK
jgi:hypothetical protein